MAATSYQASSSCSPSSSSCSYLSTAHDVFLSFRGEDTRKTFTSHLHMALTQAGIRTFLDDSELERGNDISSELLTAIEQSRISIIVFSKNYAASRWCLNELVKILECKKTFGQFVLPIFYHVDPSDVRCQTGSFANAFAKHKDLEKVEIWRAALTQLANISGWDLANGHESKFILKIVKEVMRVKKNYTCLNVCTYPVGMDSLADDVKLLLSNRSDAVCMIGIYGMGGVGKTTFAKAVYNMIFQHYECSYFLENVREVSKQLGGLVHLQEKLLSSILMIKKLKVDSVDRGISLMRETLCSKRVLIVFDDLDNSSQVKSLVGGRDWFGSGSTIIITTRDEHLLDLIQVDTKYEAEVLSFTMSLELFSWHAFRKNIPLEDYVGISKSIVSYCGGLPLALEVLGSYLYGRNNTVQWEDIFDKLKQIPNVEILNKLRISFDGLDACEKDIFLDIACFFIGREQGYVITILDACDFFPKTGLRTLREKSLLTISELKVLRMHDLLRDMGRQIVCEEFPREPGKRSRLWFQKDVIDVLEKNKGTENIEGIMLDQTWKERVYLTTQTFERMHKLRLLIINNVHLTGSFEHIFQELRWLCWTFCPLKSLPSSFQPQNLVVLDLQHSKLNILWEGAMLLENLKIIDLSHSKYLTTTPDFTGVPRLEKLRLTNCTSLNEVHPSIGGLSRLVCFNMADCMSLTSLPISICNLSSLQTLILGRCRKLEGLPDKFWSIKCLNILHTNVIISHYSIGLPPPISSLCSLELLNLSECNLADEDIPNDIGSLFSLKELDLSWNNFCRLPSLGQLSNLKNLYLRECKYLKSLPDLPCNLKSLWTFCCNSLQSLPQLPRSLETLNASDCTSLKQIPNLQGLQSLQSLSLENCCRLAEIQGLENLSSFQWMDLGGCSNLETTFVQHLIKRYIEFRPDFDLYLPRMEIPDCFKYQITGSSISFDIPHMNNVPTNHFLCFTICGVQRWCYDVRVVINNKTNGTEWSQNLCYSCSCGEFSWVTYIPKEDSTQGGDKIQVSTSLSGADHLQVERIGVYLVYESSSRDMMEIDDMVGYNKRDRDYVSAAETSCYLSPKRLKV